MAIYIFTGLVVVAAVAVVLLERWQTISTIKRLDKMLETAIDGDFAEETFDESRLSALESRLAHYLRSNSLSARKVKEQKNQISSLISDISHQTKTPVANLQLYTQLLEEQPLTPQGTECIQAISAQANKLQALTEALVKTSRLENGILALHPEVSEIALLVERAVAQYIPKASQKKVSLTAEPPEGTAVLDPKWTEEALCNLLDNAVKYTPSGGKITVDVKQYELFSVIRVTDTGPGIAETDQAKIFGRFYRGAGNYQTEGVGIGLYLTRQIAEQQGGYVKVKSAPGNGSSFALFVPRP